MEDKIHGKEKSREGMIIQYDTNDKVVYLFEKKRHEVQNKEVAKQLSHHNISQSTTIMVPVRIFHGDNHHRLGGIIDMISVNRHDEKQHHDLIQEKRSRQNHDRIIKFLSTLQSFYKDEFPFGFEAFGIADVKGLPGFTLFYSYRVGKFYIKDDDLRRENGDIDLFIRGIVDGPTSISLLQAIPYPPTAKSVKIIKMKEIVFKGVLFTGWHRERSCGEEKWIGWNDQIGMPRFTAKCSRNVYKKNHDWDFRLKFTTVTAHFNAVSREWRITEMSYTSLDLARLEHQIPCSIFIIDNLEFEGVKGDEGVFKSRDRQRDDGSPLRVNVRNENCTFDPNNIRPEYAAIVCPVFSNGGLVVSFRAIALFSKEEWLTDPFKRALTKLFYTWTAGRHLSEKIGECNHPTITF